MLNGCGGWQGRYFELSNSHFRFAGLSGKKEEGRLAAKLRSGKEHTAEQLWQSPRNR